MPAKRSAVLDRTIDVDEEHTPSLPHSRDLYFHDALIVMLDMSTSFYGHKTTAIYILHVKSLIVSVSLTTPP
jgi:hypothetical protein